MFCAGRVTDIDLQRTMKACGGAIVVSFRTFQFFHAFYSLFQSSCANISQNNLGTCAQFTEEKIGGERYNIFEGCPKAKTCTMILRGGAEQFLEETERSLHDAIMIVRRACKSDSVVAGGGAIEMELSKVFFEKKIKIVIILVLARLFSNNQRKRTNVNQRICKSA